MTGSVRVVAVSGAELAAYPRWERAFASYRKDRRYFEVVEATIRQNFDYRYFVLLDEGGKARAVQPFFVLDQDLFAGSPALARFGERARRVWPRFMTWRTLMVGSTAGEGHLDDPDELPWADQAAALAAALPAYARANRIGLVVFKEFPAQYREALAALPATGFTRVPSMPMTKLFIGYPDFDTFIQKGLTASRRSDLRRKFRATKDGPPITVTVSTEMDEATLAEIYPLYLGVYERSKMRFEKLTPDYFRALGQRMPDKVRFFVWRREGKAIAFSLCMIEGDAIYAEYLGLDYAHAIPLHLYHYAFRDVVSWAMTQGLQWFRSSGLNYDPKLHLGSLLDPLDLYVRHTSPLINAALARALPLMEPTRSDPVLPRFPNHADLWGTEKR